MRNRESRGWDSPVLSSTSVPIARELYTEKSMLANKTVYDKVRTADAISVAGLSTQPCGNVSAAI